MTSVLIVGGGLFGSMAAIFAAKAGHDVTVFDDNRPFAGSKPAACLMKPGWMSGLGDIGKEGLKIIDETFGLQTIQFDIGLGVKSDVFWVDPARIFAEARKVARWFPEKVHAVADDGFISVGDGYISGAVLVATGVWAGELIPGLPKIDALTGAAFTFEGVVPPSIRVWAPYKQLVAFEREKGTTWVGDGSAILAKNWTDAREEASFKRACNLLGRAKHTKLIKIDVGYRPYVKGHKAGYFAQLAPKLFVSTGGAKNGTVLAAYYARKFVEALK